MQKLSEAMRKFFLGMIFGISNVIPGVCSATVAYSIGIYEDVLDGISTLYKIKSCRKYYLLYFGIVFGILLSVVGLDYLYEFIPFILQSIFLGIVIRAYPIKLGTPRVRSKLRILYFFGGLLFVIGSGFLGRYYVNIDYNVINWKMIVFTGLSASFSAIALIMPGLSGALMLLTFGLYFPLIKAIKEVLHGLITFQLPNTEYLVLIAVFVIFFMVSMIAFSTIMKKALKRNPQWLSPAINGMIMGSIIVMILALGELSTTWYQYIIGLIILVILYLSKNEKSRCE